MFSSIVCSAFVVLEDRSLEMRGYIEWWRGREIKIVPFLNVYIKVKTLVLGCSEKNTHTHTE
jgi:hypothetical protein